MSGLSRVACNNLKDIITSYIPNDGAFSTLFYQSSNISKWREAMIAMSRLLGCVG